MRVEKIIFRKHRGQKKSDVAKNPVRKDPAQKIVGEGIDIRARETADGMDMPKCQAPGCVRAAAPGKPTCLALACVGWDLERARAALQQRITQDRMSRPDPDAPPPVVPVRRSAAQRARESQARTERRRRARTCPARCPTCHKPFLQTDHRAPYCRPECQQAGARARHRARNRQYQARKRREREFIPGFRHQAPGAFDAGAMS